MLCLSLNIAIMIMLARLAKHLLQPPPPIHPVPSPGENGPGPGEPKKQRVGKGLGTGAMGGFINVAAFSRGWEMIS